jgi:hypothetical protein
MCLAPALALSAPACLSPQDIELFEEEAVVNTPPIIDVRQVTPADPSICVSRLEEPIEFRIDGVRDPTPRRNAQGNPEPLLVRWFLDYEEDTGGASIIDQGQIVSLGNGLFSAVEYSSSKLDRLKLPDDTYTLEVVVSEGFADGEQPTNRAPKPDGCLRDADTNPCYVVSYRWSIKYRPEALCGQGGT